MRQEHVVIGNRDNSMRCMHCGDSYEMEMPVALDVFVKKATAFVNMHRDCPPRGTPVLTDVDTVEPETASAPRLVAGG